MTKTVQKHYAKYVTKGGDGPSVFEGRASGLGYDFVDSLGDFIAPTSLRSHPDLWKASCGNIGYPLKLLLSEDERWNDKSKPHGNNIAIMDIGCGAGHDVLLAADYFKL